MTVIVGVRCSDGIVLGADSAATNAAGNMPLLRVGTDKLQTVADRVMFATTGSVGLSQRLRAIIDRLYADKMFGKQSAVSGASIIATQMVQDMKNTGASYHQHEGWRFGALVAAEFRDSLELIEFDPIGFQPEIRKDKLFFASLGSGQTLADPFLSFVVRVMWEKKQPTIDVARFGVHWALEHTITCAPGFVGHPIKLGLFGKKAGQWECRLLDDDALAEQAQFITEIETYLRQFKSGDVEEGGAPPVPPPQPPPAA